MLRSYIFVGFQQIILKVGNFTNLLSGVHGFSFTCPCKKLKNAWKGLFKKNSHWKMQTADYCFHHANENMTAIVPLFSNPKNDGPQSVRSLHFTLPLPPKKNRVSDFWQVQCSFVISSISLNGHIRCKPNFLSPCPRKHRDLERTVSFSPTTVD